MLDAVIIKTERKGLLITSRVRLLTTYVNFLKHNTNREKSKDTSKSAAYVRTFVEENNTKTVYGHG